MPNLTPRKNKIKRIYFSFSFSFYIFIIIMTCACAFPCEVQSVRGSVSPRLPSGAGGLSAAAGVDDVSVVSDDGSPHGPKTFVLWNPPLLQPFRRSASGGGGAPPAAESEAGGRANPLQGMSLMSRTESRARKRFTK